MLVYCQKWKILTDVEYSCNTCMYFKDTDVLQGPISGYECTYQQPTWEDVQLGGA